VCSILNFILLNQAVQRIPMGTANAVWTGIGAAFRCLRSRLTSAGSFFLLLIGSIIGLKSVRTKRTLKAAR
jgi:quaternary ammonium compound-resistance protein SugE